MSSVNDHPSTPIKQYRLIVYTCFHISVNVYSLAGRQHSSDNQMSEHLIDGGSLTDGMLGKILVTKGHDCAPVGISVHNHAHVTDFECNRRIQWKSYFMY